MSVYGYTSPHTPHGYLWYNASMKASQALRAMRDARRESPVSQAWAEACAEQAEAWRLRGAVQRDPVTGRFAPGNRGGPGFPKGQTHLAARLAGRGRLSVKQWRIWQHGGAYWRLPYRDPKTGRFARRPDAAGAC